MTLQLNEKIAICYTCSGPMFREITLYHLENTYFDNDNFYYFILTDNKEYFSNCKRQNLIVNELSDFYAQYPEIEQYEYFIKAETDEEYFEKWRQTSFSFSVYRFHLLQALKYGITNVGMFCVDSWIDFDKLNRENTLQETFDYLISTKNKLQVAIGVYQIDPEFPQYEKLKTVCDTINKRYGYNLDAKEIPVPDAAIRFFTFESTDQMKKLFSLWQDLIVHLYQTEEIEMHKGWRVINDEFILAPLYYIVGIRDLIHLELIYIAHHDMMRLFYFGKGKLKFTPNYITEIGTKDQVEYLNSLTEWNT